MLLKDLGLIDTDAAAKGVRKGVLRNLANFTGKKTLLLLKKKLMHRSFPVNFVKFLRTTLLQNTSRRLLLLITLATTQASSRKLKPGSTLKKNTSDAKRFKGHFKIQFVPA